MSEYEESQDEEKHRHHHHHHHGSKNEKKVIHHNHYKHGSVVSSYTAAVEGTGQLSRTTPFKPCPPKSKKRIELVIKQEGGYGYVAHDQIQVPRTQRQVLPPTQVQVQPPPTTQYTYSSPPPPIQYYAPPTQYVPVAPIYEPPPPARRYEEYRRTEVDDRRFNYDNQAQQQRYPVEVPLRRNGLYSRGTGTNTTRTQAKRRVTLVAEQSPMTFQDSDQMTEGTGASMVLDPIDTGAGPNRLVIIKRDERLYPVHYDGAMAADRSETEGREGDLCPLCHVRCFKPYKTLRYRFDIVLQKGWYVKKFTWSGIVSAIFCFPCGIFFCFRMRINVCSFCGEEPVAEYKDYKEANAEKTKGDEDSRSRVIPPQKSSRWQRQSERDVKGHEGDKEADRR